MTGWRLIELWRIAVCAIRGHVRPEMLPTGVRYVWCARCQVAIVGELCDTCEEGDQ